MAETNQTYQQAQAAPTAPPIPPVTPPRAPAAPAIPPEGRGSGTNRGIGFGVALIILGMTALWAQLVPGVTWFELWPLIIVAAGVAQMITPGWGDERGIMRVFDGFGTVLIGLVFLGNTLGYIEWSVWFVLLTLWPVLLVAAGISIIGKGIGQQWLRAVAPVVIWIALAVAVSTSLTPQVPFSLPYVITVQPSTIPFIILNGR